MNRGDRARINATDYASAGDPYIGATGIVMNDPATDGFLVVGCFTKDGKPLTAVPTVFHAAQVTAPPVEPPPPPPPPDGPKITVSGLGVLTWTDTAAAGYVVALIAPDGTTTYRPTKAPMFAPDAHPGETWQYDVRPEPDTGAWYGRVSYVWPGAAPPPPPPPPPPAQGTIAKGVCAWPWQHVQAKQLVGAGGWMRHDWPSESGSSAQGIAQTIHGDGMKWLVCIDIYYNGRSDDTILKHCVEAVDGGCDALEFGNEPYAGARYIEPREVGRQYTAVIGKLKAKGGRYATVPCIIPTSAGPYSASYAAGSWWTDELFAGGGPNLPALVDAVSVHNYTGDIDPAVPAGPDGYHPAGQDGWKGAFDQFVAVNKWVRAKGVPPERAKIWMTEWGYWTGLPRTAYMTHAVAVIKQHADIIGGVFPFDILWRQPGNDANWGLFTNDLTAFKSDANDPSAASPQSNSAGYVYAQARF